LYLRPEMRALRSDDTPQRVAQSGLFRAADDWRGRADVADVLAELAAFASVRSLAECPALSGLFDDGNPAAQRLVCSFVDAYCAGLDAAPFGHVPVRHFTDGTLSTLLLGRAGGVSLTLVAINGAAIAARPAPVSISFSPNDSWEHVLAGHAQGELIECRRTQQHDVALDRRPVSLAPGSITARKGSRQALLLKSVAGCLVSLRLQRRHDAPGPTREYDLASGTMVHQAAGTARESRQELMVSLLGRMGRSDAAPVLAEMAQERGRDALRWQALRECLGLDTLAGFHALCAIARSADDPLAVAAGALRSQLIEAHPQLAGAEPCPA
jgi:hypothetical protein